MAVLRLENKLLLEQSGVLITMYGRVMQEEFIGPDLKLYNIERMLWHYLKKQEFERIVFFDSTRRIYCYDNKSYELCFP